MRVRTLGLVVAGLAALAGCKREPSFDERYASARKAIGEKAGELDRDMAQRATTAPDAQTVSNASSTP